MGIKFLFMTHSVSITLKDNYIRYTVHVFTLHKHMYMQRIRLHLLDIVCAILFRFHCFPSFRKT